MLYIITFVSAVFLSSTVSVLPPKFVLYVLLIGVAYCCYRKQRFIACICGGALVSFVHGYYLLSQQLPQILEATPVVVEGYVVDLPVSKPNREQFLLEVKYAENTRGDAVPNLLRQKIRLSWYHNRFSKDLSEIPLLQPGQFWRLTVKLRRPRGFVNPSGFDYQLLLLRQGISATGYVVNADNMSLLGENCYSIRIDCMRWWIQQNIKRLLLQSHNTEVDFLSGGHTENSLGPLVALLVGDTQWLTPSQWELFKNTGTIHLLAISGLHIGLAATVGFFVGRLLSRLVAITAPYTLIVPRYLPAFCSVILAFFYAMLAGMSLPTQRALVMVIFYHIARLYFYRILPSNLLTMALLVVALMDPLAIYGQGFWLSFLAVALLMYGFGGRNAKRCSSRLSTSGQYVYSLCASQWILGVGLLIPSLLLLQGVSLSAPIVNLFAVTWVSLIVVPLLFLLLLFMGLSHFGGSNTLSVIELNVYHLAQWSMSFLLEGLDYLDNLMPPFWLSTLGEPSKTAIVLSVVGVIGLLSPLSRVYKYCAVLCFLPLFYPMANPITLRITFMDAGQGTAIVVETHSHTLVYDTGQAYSERFNVGEHIIAPYLRQERRLPLDRLMVSHADMDHAGGAKALLASVDVEEVYSGLPLSEVPNTQQCHAGQNWVWDDVYFKVIWPELDKLPHINRRNNTSCVLLISFNGRHILLTGDIEKKVEQQLLRHQDLPERIDIMSIPHHGSKTSSSRQWIERIQPKWSVVTAGYNNRYNHPDPSVVARYQKLSSQVLNTATSGALQWSLNTKGQWVLARWREDYRRYWYD